MTAIIGGLNFSNSNSEHRSQIQKRSLFQKMHISVESHLKQNHLSSVRKRQWLWTMYIWHINKFFSILNRICLLPKKYNNDFAI